MSNEHEALGSIGLVASIFGNMNQHNKMTDKVVNAWKEPVAEILRIVAKALRDGVPPEAMATICDALAEAALNTDDIPAIEKKLLKVISEME